MQSHREKAVEIRAFPELFVHKSIKTEIPALISLLIPLKCLWVSKSHVKLQFDLFVPLKESE